jgi:hypothetical protein
LVSRILFDEPRSHPAFAGTSFRKKMLYDLWQANAEVPP